MRDLILIDKGLVYDGFGSILRENVEQIKEWGLQTHDAFEWLALTTEELGELSKAILEYIYKDGKLKEIETEAIQVATLALKIAVMTRRAISIEDALSEVTDDIYPMCEQRPVQLDCRLEQCRFHSNGKCTNPAPAITLNENGACNCWTNLEEQGE